MGKVADDLMGKLYATNPYESFPYRDYPLDLQGSDNHPLFRKLITAVRPRLIIEIGSWKGDSAIGMATILKEQQADAAVICIDTWLGSIEHLTGVVPGWDIRRFSRHGYPTLYYQWLANVMHSQCQDLVIPIANTSVNAARWLLQQGIVADLIYVDGSHEEDDVHQDLCCFWKLLRAGGIIFGDDWDAYWYGVVCAVNRFAREKDIRLWVVDKKWILRKREAP
jgi:hypothetical protein